MTLFMLESGLTQASEATKKWFNRPYSEFFKFFVKKNDNGTFTFINSRNPSDRLTTSLVKEVMVAENGCRRIITQNSVIIITPACCSIKEVECFTEELQDIIHSFKIKGVEVECNSIGYLPIGNYTISGGIDSEWIDNTIYLYKTEEGIIIEENCWKTEDNNESYYEIATFYPIKIGGKLLKESTSK